MLEFLLVWLHRGRCRRWLWLQGGRRHWRDGRGSWQGVTAERARPAIAKVVPLPQRRKVAASVRVAIPRGPAPPAGAVDRFPRGRANAVALPTTRVAASNGRPKLVHQDDDTTLCQLEPHLACGDTAAAGKKLAVAQHGNAVALRAVHKVGHAAPCTPRANACAECATCVGSTAVHAVQPTHASTIVTRTQVVYVVECAPRPLLYAHIARSIRTYIFHRLAYLST